MARQKALSKIRQNKTLFQHTKTIWTVFLYYYIRLKINLILKTAIKKHPQIMQVRIFSGAGDETRTRDT